MRLIDADALQKEYMYEYDGKRLMLIDTAPTIEERKKGRWIKKEERVYYWYECSECGAKPLWNEWRTDRCFSAFCPNCGADMRERT